MKTQLEVHDLEVLASGSRVYYKVSFQDLLIVMSSHKVSLLLGISLALLLLAVSSVRGESANAEPEGEPEPENGATTQAHAASFYQVCSLSTFKLALSRYPEKIGSGTVF